MDDGINKKISSVLKEVSKAFGEGSAMILGDDNYNFDIERVSSGSLNLDLALGGGIPRGRIIEVYGQPSSGKTTLTILHAVEIQRSVPNKYILYIDLEHTIDKKLFEDYGLDSNKVIIVQPDTAEEAFDIMEMFIRSETISLAIVDSVSAILPKEEADKDMSSQQMGLIARFMGKALRKLTPVVSNTNTSIIFINQIREKIGVMYGNPETTSGGRALAFYASIRINVRAGEKIPNPKNKDESIGHVINITVSKNKTAVPFKKASFDLFYAVGVDKKKEIADIAVISNWITRSGAYYQFKDEAGNKVKRTTSVGEEVELSFQGKESLIDYLKKDAELYQVLEDAVMTGVEPKLEDIKGQAAVTSIEENSTEE